MSPERAADLRDRAELQLRRHAEFGGLESNFQVAINPSELLEFLDAATCKTDYAYALNEHVEIYGKSSKEWHRGHVCAVDWPYVSVLLQGSPDAEIVVRDMGDHEDRIHIRRCSHG